MKKIVVTYQLSPEVVVIIQEYAKFYNMPKQVAVERLIIKGFQNDQVNQKKESK